MRSYLRRLVPWLGWLGLLATLLFGLLGIWSGFFYARAPGLLFQELANTSVFAINEPVAQLQVRYRGRELASSGKTLTFLQIRAVNDGTAPILQSYYDMRDLPGVRVEDAEVLEARVVGASSSYVRRSVLLLASKRAVTFRPVILEPADYFVLKLLLLHERASSPRLMAAGKIAGVPSIKYDAMALQGPTSVLRTAFAGPPLVQLLRVIAYFVGAVLLIGAITWPSFKLSDWRRIKHRRRHGEALLSSPEATDPLFKHFLDQYVQYGDWYLWRILEILDHPHNFYNPETLYRRDIATQPSSVRIIKDLEELGILKHSSSEGATRVAVFEKERARRLVEQILEAAPAER